MKSTRQYVCPVSNKRTRALPISEEPEGTFFVVDAEEGVEAIDASLPVGWGRLVLEVVATNPEVEAARLERENAVASALRMARGMLEDSEIPAAVRNEVRAQLESGAAEKAATERAESEHPDPEDETIVLRLSFPVLSDEAVGTAIKALREAGFPISEDA